MPPNSHCRNATDRAIRTAKTHFIAILSATHENFILYLWCYLLQQAEITLNLLRTSRSHPHLSAYNSICGVFNFKRTPLSPPGIKVIAYNSVETRESWVTHGKLGHYVGPTMNHYQCYKVCVPSTRKIIISDTLQHTEDNLFEVPHKTKDDNLHDMVNELQTMLQSQFPLATHTNNPRAQAIEKLRNLLLQTSTSNEITSPLQRVSETDDKIQLPMVSVSFTDDPPELEDEINYDADNSTNVVFTEYKQYNAHISPPSLTHEKHDSRYHLRLSKPSHVDTLCKYIAISTPTTNTSQDL